MQHNLKFQNNSSSLGEIKGSSWKDHFEPFGKSSHIRIPKGAQRNADPDVWELTWSHPLKQWRAGRCAGPPLWREGTAAPWGHSATALPEPGTSCQYTYLYLCCTFTGRCVVKSQVHRFQDREGSRHRGVRGLHAQRIPWKEDSQIQRTSGKEDSR